MNRILLKLTLFFFTLCCLLASCQQDEGQEMSINTNCILDGTINGKDWCGISSAAVRTTGKGGNDLISIGATGAGDALSFAFMANQPGKQSLISGAFVNESNIVYNFVEGMIDITNVSGKDISGSFTLNVTTTTVDPGTLVITGKFNRLPFE